MVRSAAAAVGRWGEARDRNLRHERRYQYRATPRLPAGAHGTDGLVPWATADERESPRGRTRPAAPIRPSLRSSGMRSQVRASEPDVVDPPSLALTHKADIDPVGLLAGSRPEEQVRRIA